MVISFEDLKSQVEDNCTHACVRFKDLTNGCEGMAVRIDNEMSDEYGPGVVMVLWDDGDYGDVEDAHLVEITSYIKWEDEDA